MVIRCFTTAFTIAEMSRGLGSRTMVAAAPIGKFMQTVIPNTWNSGSADRMTSDPWAMCIQVMLC